MDDQRKNRKNFSMPYRDEIMAESLKSLAMSATESHRHASRVWQCLSIGGPIMSALTRIC